MSKIKYIGVDKKGTVYGYYKEPIKCYYSWLGSGKFITTLNYGLLQALLCDKLKKGKLYEVTKTHLQEIDKL